MIMEKTVLSVLWGSFLALPAYNANAAAELAYDGSDMAVDEIVVFARKRREKIQDIPASVGILSASLIEGAGLSGLKDIAAMTANFAYDEAFGRNNVQRPVIRGMSNVLGAANVAFFIDGVFVPGGIASTSLFDLERVEIMKGPGSALYGRWRREALAQLQARRPNGEIPRA